MFILKLLCSAVYKFNKLYRHCTVSTSRLYSNLERVRRSSHGNDDVVQVRGAGRGREEAELLQHVRREEEDLGGSEWTSQSNDSSL